MAWQTSVGMGPNGGNIGGSDAGGPANGQPQGTEYTLQGRDLDTWIASPSSNQQLSERWANVCF